MRMIEVSRSSSVLGSFYAGAYRSPGSASRRASLDLRCGYEQLPKPPILSHPLFASPVEDAKPPGTPRPPPECVGLDFSSCEQLVQLPGKSGGVLGGNGPDRAN